MNLKDDDYVLEEGAAWFTVEGFSVRLLSVDDGLWIAVYKNGEEMEDPVASTFAYNEEVSDNNLVSLESDRGELVEGEQ